MKKCMMYVVALSMTTVAYADDDSYAIEKNSGIYASAKFGYMGVRVKTKVEEYSEPVYSGTDDAPNMRGVVLAVGYKINPWFRFELEGGGFLPHYLGGGQAAETTIVTGMGQLYVDFPISNIPMKPYLNLGAGFLCYDGRLDSDGRDLSVTMGYDSLGIGLTYSFSEQLTLDASYRYAVTGRSSVTWDEGGKPYRQTLSLVTSTVLVGVRYIF